MSKFKETFESFSLKSGLLDKAEAIDALQDAALKAESFARFWTKLTEVTKFIAGYYDQDAVGLCTTNYFQQGPPIVSPKYKSAPHENDDRCCRARNWGIQIDGKLSEILGRLVSGDFTEEDMSVLTSEKSSAQSMLDLFEQQWTYGMTEPMLIQLDKNKWVRQANMRGIDDRMNQMCAGGLPPRKAKKGKAPVVHTGERETMSAKAKRLRQMAGQDTAQPVAPVNPLAGFRA